MHISTETSSGVLAVAGDCLFHHQPEYGHQLNTEVVVDDAIASGNCPIYYAKRIA